MTTTSPDITNSSALQLYHTAYRYHYETNEIKEACRLYREIIRHFPESNECAYAVIQLEKIGAQEAIKILNGGSLYKVLAFIALLFSLFALFIAGTALLLVLDNKELSWYTDSAESLCCTISEDIPDSLRQIDSNLPVI